MSGGVAPLDTPEDIGPRVVAATPHVMYAAPPLMHGTAVLATFITFLNGGKVCLTRKYTGDGALRVIQEQGCQTMMIVGDAMAVPLIEALDTAGHGLPSLHVIASAGALLTQPVRDRLRAHLPEVYIVDSFGSTETGHSGAGVDQGLRFTVNDTTTVLDDALRPVTPGSGVVGQVARRGHIALGYYRDPDKTARTFVEVDGVRWVLSGDLATVDTDGTVTFLGRGSICVNSGGEKIHRRRSKPLSRPTRPSRTRSSPASPTRAGARKSRPYSNSTPRRSPRAAATSRTTSP
jgi:acyl-coenzyme A synthetase/AMP-(fatty) acid ligase